MWKVTIGCLDHPVLWVETADDKFKKKKKSLHNSLRHECSVTASGKDFVVYSWPLAFVLAEWIIQQWVNSKECYWSFKVLSLYQKKDKQKFIWQNQILSRSMWATQMCADFWPPGGSRSTSPELLSSQAFSWRNYKVRKTLFFLPGIFVMHKPGHKCFIAL